MRPRRNYGARAHWRGRPFCHGTDEAGTVLHRGPDAGGTWADAEAGIALAHRRLSIIDLSEAGAQLMMSASGRYTIAFNGEIYNFAELRARLEGSGHAPAWRGRSDTEVFLEALAAWGVAATLEKLVLAASR